MKLIKSTKFTAVLDANVLFPIVIRDYLMWLALYELYIPKWSNEILNEVASVFERRKPDISPTVVSRQIDAMKNCFPFATVENYEAWIATLILPDPKDRHVLAAAIHCNADVIVTRNLKDFPSDYLVKYEIEALDPDNFIADLISLSPDYAYEAFREMVLAKNKPPFNETQYIEVFRKCQLTETANLLSQMI